MSPRVVVITGATAGVGRATAHAYARRGWSVALLARGRTGLEATRRDVERLGGAALALPTDVADEQAIDAAAAAVVATWGAIDVWINNAMATVFGSVTDVTPEDFRRATDVTYLGAVWGTRAALRHMRVRDRGVIVQVGSGLAYRSIPLQAAYCGAKSALRGYTDALRCELPHEGSRIHLTSVHLSAFNTPQFDWGRSLLSARPRPLGQVFQTEVAAAAIYWASQRRRREVWVGAPAVQTILGTRIVPGLLDRFLAHRGYAGQQEGDHPAPSRPDNLYLPVEHDAGAHGRFDAEARTASLQMALNRQRGPLALGLLACASLLYAARRRRP